MVSLENDLIRVKREYMRGFLLSEVSRLTLGARSNGCWLVFVLASLLCFGSQGRSRDTLS
jgi:hypothetical protein